MKQLQAVFSLPEGFSPEAILAALGEAYPVRLHSNKKEQHLYLDSYDFRLAQQNMTLSFSQGVYTLAFDGGEKVCSQKGHRTKKVYAGNFSVSEFRDQLMQHVESRALLPFFVCIRGIERFLVCNKEQKTIARLHFVTGTASVASVSLTLPPQLIVEALRGYNGQCRKIIELLHASGLQKTIFSAPLLPLIIPELGSSYQERTARFAISLPPRTTAGAAIAIIGQQLLRTLQWNLPGVCKDIDSEFLHDFRVAVRRIRSLLSLLKKILPDQERRQLQNEFRWLFSVTGAQRDLDVYLLNKDSYLALLPDSLRDGLNVFFTNLAGSRARALKRTGQALGTARLTALFSEWEKFLEYCHTQQDTALADSASQLAEKLIRRRHKQILRQGKRIADDSSAEELHALRIATKKFRYLLEFFRSVCQQEAIDGYLSHLKKLQNNLGDYNDRSVQLRLLVAYQKKMRSNQRQALAIAAALGGLIVQLHGEQLQIRARFTKAFEQFSSQENIDLLDSMFFDDAEPADQETLRHEDTCSIQ